MHTYFIWVTNSDLIHVDFQARFHDITARFNNVTDEKIVTTLNQRFTKKL